ncbi:MAG: Fic family protein [Chloroflexi bacterium CFX7]|nr:Fic family protein [Chloroflexi bacterium CFX7]
MSQSPDRAGRWSPITPLPRDLEQANGTFAALDELRREWDRQLSAVTETERIRRHQRSLRRLALETGVLERLYDINWGLTLTLVAHGFAREVVERAGGDIDDGTLATLAAQREALEMVTDFVRANRNLTSGFIQELHAAITRTQRTYTAIDMLGRVTETELPHGTWKKWPNHVRRHDGSLLEYCPPEHVSTEVDNLTTWYEEMERERRAHPVICAAWLHHRFVQIHPFADGNGRVARALTLVVMQRHHYAPLVVDRFRKADYLSALDDANDGDLRPLVKLFVSLESAALAGELESWEEPKSGTSLDVAHTLAAQLAARRAKEAESIRRDLDTRARFVAGLLKYWFERKRDELQGIFRSQGVNAEVMVSLEVPPDSERTHYFKRQVIESARRAGHFADLGGCTAWARLVVVVEGTKASYVASLHAAGREPGVMAITTFAVLGQAPTKRETPLEDHPAPTDLPTTSEAFRFVHTETTEALSGRSEELYEFLDSGLSVALADLSQRI